ncbi:MAG: 3-isopropylmalate dehydratase small subunit [Candidatus Gygaella obscura]|nr:3-isopropylmalate dehydratase small subunit [Candidatus Gygaella obscura]
MVLKGKVHKFGNNINTDEIIPARYLNTIDAVELGRHCMEDTDKDFVKNMNIGDIIVAGKNFGCGSSREHAPIAIKGSGVSCVIAKSFARIFYRNSINIGLPILELVQANELKEKDILEIDLLKGQIRNLTTKKIYCSQKFPKFMQAIIDKGGLMNWIKKAILRKA